jgi:predicted nucleotide-binding protein
VEHAEEVVHGQPDPRTVFVVHGRNEDLRRAMFEFLRSIDLRPMEWTRAVQLTGIGSPYIGQVLDAAFSHAQAIVVLMTPDEVAYLQTRYARGADDTEATPGAQARPNVLFEAGMALGRNPDRTVLVEVGQLRAFSDVAGRHAIRLNNDPAPRQALATRLRTAGCPVDTTGTDWQTTGDFTPPPPPGDGLPLGRRLPPATNTRPPIQFDANYHDRGRGGGRLQIINRGTETAYDITVSAPEESAMELDHRESTIEKIPGGGKSVSLSVFNRGRMLGSAGAKTAFDLTLTARTDSGEHVSQDVFLDMKD